LLDGSEFGDNSAFSSSDSYSFADASLDASAVGSDSAADDVTFPAETQAPLPPVAPPVVDGVKMFGQCGGIFYSGNTACADSDAFCKELSIYSSICSPRPVKQSPNTASHAMLHYPNPNAILRGIQQRSCPAAA